MRKVVYGCAMSLDGFIAGPNGEYDWIVMDPEIDFAALMARFDTFLIGRKTFEVMRQMGDAAPPAPGIRNIVFSRTLRPADCPQREVERRSGRSRDRTAEEAGQGHRSLRRRRAVPEPSGSRTGRRGERFPRPGPLGRRDPVSAPTRESREAEAQETSYLRKERNRRARLRCGPPEEMKRPSATVRTGRAECRHDTARSRIHDNVVTPDAAAG